MMRRLFTAITLAVSLLGGGTGIAFAQKTVHVKTYVKKDGTVVQAHDRKAPEKKGDNTSSTASTTTSSASSSSAKSTTTSTASTTHPSTYCTTCARDEKGRILRGEAAKLAFMKQTGYAHGRPGYVIDHIIALACGGPDNTSNMQWQTIAAAKEKDKVERQGCGK